LHPNLLCQAEPNGWFSAIRLIVKISGPGHQLPVAVTSKFLGPGGIEWLVFGDQIDRGDFRTRPEAALLMCFSEADIAQVKLYGILMLLY